MAQIRSHAGSTDDIITAQFVDLRREFAEEREGLADSAGGSEDGYLGVCGGGGVDGAGGGAEGCDCFGGEAVEHHGWKCWIENSMKGEHVVQNLNGCALSVMMVKILRPFLQIVARRCLFT